MNSMFEGCSSLTAVPLFDTSHVNYMASTFRDCSAVASGALALYTQASTQTNPPTSHYKTFAYCGSDTVTGRADLDAIPTDWGGNRRLWQNDYFIELTSSSADDMHFCYLVFNGMRNTSISSGQYTNDNTTWTQLTSADLSTLNTYSGPDWYANAMTAQFYFSANGDPVPSCYFYSGDSSTVPSMSITATLYGKRIGESTWTSITSKSYTQSNGYRVYLLS
jgi:surface protein